MSIPPERIRDLLAEVAALWPGASVFQMTSPEVQGGHADFLVVADKPPGRTRARALAGRLEGPLEKSGHVLFMAREEFEATRGQSGRLAFRADKTGKLLES